MKRKFTIIIEVIDNEEPNEDNATASDAMSDYMRDALSDLAFEIQDLKVSCE